MEETGLTHHGKKDELAAMMMSDAEISSTFGSSKISTYSQTEGNTCMPSDTSSISAHFHVSSETDHIFVDSKTEKSTHTSGEISSVSSTDHSSCSVMHNSSQTEESGYVSATTESSSISESPAEVFLSPETSCKNSEATPNVFFPKSEEYKSNFRPCERLEGISELDTNVSTPVDRNEWVMMDRKFIQKEGYRLGVIPGTFYNSNKGYFVEMPNGTNYEIILTNETPVPCNVEVFIDNRAMPAICFRLRPDKPMKFDGPTWCENKFMFVRSKDAPLKSGISLANTSNGIIEAVFTPQKIESVRSRTESEPIPFSRNVNNALQILGIEATTQKLRSYTTSCVSPERGIDITNFCQGATALRGKQNPKILKKAEAMETDDTRRVIIRLRIITRTDEPNIPSEEDICSLCPPSIEELLGN